MSKSSGHGYLSDVWRVPLVYNQTVDSCSLSLSWVQLQAKDALALARLAAKYNRQGLRQVAARLYAAAEESHYLILVATCDLTDAEADLLEPLITDLEGELWRLAQSASGIANQDN